ncbi:hypothetical protein PI125_g14791 [Phytophthora idaei]|nr:hypothetical protein PI125_g14791 [Phytophthora idaei]KAG3151426.1 hypothetical protein PI126_g11014 [Phytophthora idaei]
MAKRKVNATGGGGEKRKRVMRGTERGCSGATTLSTTAAFKYAWKKLRKAGWTTDTATLNPRGKEDEAFDVGEASVVKYVSDQKQLHYPTAYALLVPASAMGGEGRAPPPPDQDGRGGAGDGRGIGRRCGATRGGARGRHDGARSAAAGRGGIGA